MSKDKEVIIGQKIIRLDRVSSTNDFARELSSYIQPVIEGTTIIANDQYQGKGRHRKNWNSEAGKNAIMSIVLFPNNLRATNIFLLSKAISLGLLDFLKSIHADEPKIKWPNDILCGNAKIAGVLIENTWKGQQLSESVVGVGMNINQTNFDPEANTITSLSKLRKKEFDLDEVLLQILLFLEKRYIALKRGEFEDIDHDYFQNLYGKNRQRRYRDSIGNEFNARILGVSDDGLLTLKKEGGQKASYNLDELVMLRNEL